jgi:hypothetical protein
MRDRLVLTNEWGGLGGTKGAVKDLRVKLGELGRAGRMSRNSGEIDGIRTDRYGRKNG